MAPQTCQHCGSTIDLFARSDARFCSGSCRVAAHRARHASDPVVPAALRERSRWVRHRAKRPLTVTGRPASTTDSRTWNDYATATKSKVGDGIGFVLDGDGIVCVDLDRCLSGGRLLPWARALLEHVPRTYTEVSPSGRGLHIWGLGRLERGRRIRFADGNTVELYGSGRYLTVTGRRFRSSPSRLADLTDFIGLLT